jgi:hypothetical protein
MNKVFLRSCVALACAFGLASCGGGSGNLLLGGNIYGLTKSGLFLQNGSKTPIEIQPTATGFSFPDLLASDESFEVKISTQPKGAVCTVTNGKGKTSTFNITSVIVSCVTDTYHLGGSITGTLDANGLILANGSDTMAVPAGAKTFSMTRFNADGTVAGGKVADGAPYGITIYQQPSPRLCTVANGVGKMGSADRKDVVVNCN